MASGVHTARQAEQQASRLQKHPSCPHRHLRASQHPALDRDRPVEHKHLEKRWPRPTRRTCHPAEPKRSNADCHPHQTAGLRRRLLRVVRWAVARCSCWAAAIAPRRSRDPKTEHMPAIWAASAARRRTTVLTSPPCISPPPHIGATVRQKRADNDVTSRLQRDRRRRRGQAEWLTTASSAQICAVSAVLKTVRKGMQ